MPGVQELLVIAVVALLVFGPNRLPEFARNAARMLVKVRSEARRNVEEFRQLADIDDLERDLRGVADELQLDRRNPRRRPTPVRVVSPTEPVDPRASSVQQRDADRPPPTDMEAT
ncbi:MAG: twin-arginine translocase TatA/TatE family subunit [Nitriliruptoraceae bacterium]